MSDLLIHNAQLRSMDPACPRAEWVLIRGGVIVALGDGAPPGAAEKIDAGGRLVLPGFQDAHVHLLSGGLDLATAASLYEVLTGAGLLAAVAAHAARRPELPLLIGAGWAPGPFGNHNLNAALIDPVTGDRPAVLYDSSFHNACLNSAALRMAGIGDDTPDPPNGHIVRDTAGRATGMLHEEAIPWAVERLPGFSDAQWLEGLLAGQAHANAHGITGVLDPKITAQEHRIYRRALDEGRLTLRVAGAAAVTEADTPESAVARLTAMRAEAPGPEYHLHSAKFFMDGVFENRTAALKAPYADAPGSNAPCMFGKDQTEALFTALDAARFAIHVHVVGDAAAARALDGLEAARAANGYWPAAHQLAHLQLVAPEDFARLATAGATANIQPLWARLDPLVPDIALDSIGAARRPCTYAFRRMLEAGADWSLSSDWPVSTLNPFEIIETAVTRQARRADGAREPFLPEEALTVQECVLGYTAQAAAACWRGGFTGRLRPGFSADLVVLDQDVFACAPHEIGNTKVLLTLFKGRAVYRPGPV
ncbi:MAG: amidohydrolase [Pararhodobacter sp.]